MGGARGQDQGAGLALQVPTATRNGRLRPSTLRPGPDGDQAQHPLAPARRWVSALPLSGHVA